MKIPIKKLILMSGFLMLMCLSANSAAAQSDRLRNGVAVEGDAGSTYVSHFIRVRKGQTVTVSIKRRVAKDGNFNLIVSPDANFLETGKEIRGKTVSTRNTLTWTRRAGANGNYYFFLSAYPTTSYTIRVTLK